MLRNKKMILTIVITILIVAIAGTTYFSRLAYAVKVDDEIIGVVRDVEKVDEIIENLKKDVEVTYNMKVKVSQTITYGKISASDNELTDLKLIKNKLKEKINYDTEAYSINANGKDLVFLKDESAAKEILDRLEHKYLENNEEVIETESSSKVEFVEEVEVIKGYTSIDNIMNLEDAYSYITIGTKEIEEYTVKQGDMVSSISAEYDISIKDIQRINPELDIDRLKIGQKINLTVAKPLINISTKETITYEEDISYEVIYEYTDTIYEGSSKVKVAGKEGKKEVVAQLKKVNGILSEKIILEEKVIEESQTKVILRGTKARPETLAYGSFIKPGGTQLTSRFGSRWGGQHTGIDIGMSTGTSIKASDGGKVTFSGWKGSYGYLVIIDHENGYQTYYGHNSKLLVKQGDRVYRGQVISKSGATGNVTGPHLHFEIRKNGTPVDPLNYVNY